MKVRILLAVILVNAFLTLSAQEGKFGFIDFNATLRRMPEYLEAEINLRKIQNEYHEEIERSKREFERQYIDFLLEQDHLSASIVAKRQKELQLLMDNNAQFRDNVQLELEARRDEMLMKIKKKLLSAVSDVCTGQNQPGLRSGYRQGNLSLHQSGERCRHNRSRIRDSWNREKDRDCCRGRTACH